MPLLCAVATTYMATDTHMETKIEIPQNAPMIGAVRETAIKALEAKATAPTSPTAPSSDSANPAPSAAEAAARAELTPIR
jgi:hypothetical protein